MSSPLNVYYVNCEEKIFFIIVGLIHIWVSERKSVLTF